MSMTVDVNRDRSVLILASNLATSTQTGWPIGFWWSERPTPTGTLTEAGYRVDIASPDGGALTGDAYSDPTDPSGYSADDLLSLGFLTSPATRALVEQSTPLAGVDPADYDAVLVIGGQGPMYTFFNDERVRRLVAWNYEAGRITAAICHGTACCSRPARPTGPSWSTAADLDKRARSANSEEEVRRPGGRGRRSSRSGIRGRSAGSAEHAILHRAGQASARRADRRRQPRSPGSSSTPARLAAEAHHRSGGAVTAPAAPSPGSGRVTVCTIGVGHDGRHLVPA